MGLSYEKIKNIINCERNSVDILAGHKEELKNRIAEIEEQLTEVDCLIGKRETQQYKPYLEHIEACSVYYSRSFIKDVNHIMDFIKLTLGELKKTNPGVGFPKPDYCCIIYPDDSYRDTDIFVEYVQSVDKIGIDTPVIKFKTLEAVNVISVTHYGSYDNLRDAYLSVVTYALDNGYLCI